MSNDVLVQANNVRKWFPISKWFFEKQKYVKAVDDVTLTLYRGETLGIVGESGCGKSTLARTLLRLIEPTEGDITYDDKDLVAMRGEELRSLRKHMQIVFQDPYSSLHPRMKVGRIIAEPLLISGIYRTQAECMPRIYELLEMVGLDREYVNRYPHEFSGGQRQRIVIARALATNPELLICDEPVSALDVSIQAQIINLLNKLQEERKLTYLFISHDLSVVEHISDTVGVMYLGNLVEYGATKDIFKHPLHPYTKALFSAIPIPDPHAKMKRIVLEGSIPSPANPPAGCKFHTRCAQCMECCKTEVPKQVEVEPGHFVVCHLYNKK
jgi:oligopeptide/dipeptide ABC transporter ATP-binding protein